MSNNTRSSPLGPLGPLGKRGESIAVGQVAMATAHGGRRTAWAGGVGFLIGGRPSGSLEEDAMGARVGCPLPRTPREVGEGKEKGSKGARMPCLTTAQSTVFKYCEQQHCATKGEPGIFAGPSLLEGVNTTRK